MDDTSNFLRRWKKNFPLARTDSSPEEGPPGPVAKLPAPTASVYDAVPLPLGDTKYIRVIRVWPSHLADFSDRIVCTFEILDAVSKVLLTDNGVAKQREDHHAKKIHYRALSYTWGASSPTQFIRLNGRSFTIRQNLWDFLDRARRNNSDNYLWIDALCINQESIQERNHQVAMMGVVYSNAEGVIVWLGAGHPWSISAINELYTTLLEHGVHEATQMVYDVTAWKLIMVLFNQPYWSRIWIVQEYVLATRVDIWYGDLQMQSEVLAEFLTSTKYNAFLAMTTATRIVIWRQHMADRSEENAKQLADRSQEDVLARRHETFRRLILRFGVDMKCSDSRDMVYALLPLLSVTEKRELDIYPDYSILASELYVTVVDRLQNSASLYGGDEQHLVMRNLALMLDVASRSGGND